MNTKKLLQLVSTVFLIFAFQIIPTSVFARSIQPTQIISVTVSSQNGVSIYGTPGSVTYSVSATGVGISNTGWSVSDLPAGVSGYFTATNTPASDFWNTQLVLVNSDTAPNPGPYTFTVNATNLDNPATFATNTGTFQVEKKKISANLLTENKTYDGTTDAASACVFSAKVGSDDISCTITSSSFESPNAGPSILVNGSGVVMSGTDSGKYILTSTDATGTAEILQLNQVVSFDVPQDLVYFPNKTIEIQNITSSSGLPVTFRSSGACSVSGSALTILSAGICFVSATSVGNANYSSTTYLTGNLSDGEQRSRFNIFKASQEITFAPISLTATFGDSNIALVATSTSGLPIKFRTSGACSVNSNSELVFTSGGNCSVVASVPATSGYLAAPEIKYIVSVAKATQTIMFTLPSLTATFGDKPMLLDAVSSSGLKVVYRTAGSCSVSLGQLVFNSGGNCVVVASVPATNTYFAAPEVRYTIAVAKATQTITFTFATTTALLVNSPLTLNATSTSGLPISYRTAYNCSASGGLLALTTTGRCGVVATQVGNTQYYPANEVRYTLNIK